MRVQFIDPGAFRSELSLQRAVATPDGAGGHTRTWEEVARLFAMIEPTRAFVRSGAGQEHEKLTHRVTLRFRTDVRSGMRFVRLGRVFAILAVHDPDESRRYLVCRAQEEER